MELNKETEADETCATEDREDAIEQQLVQQRGSTPVGLLPLPQATASDAGWDDLSYGIPDMASCRPPIGSGRVTSELISMITPPSTNEPTAEEVTHKSETNGCHYVKYLFQRCWDLLAIPLALVFGIVLYLVDVGSDIWAAVDHFQEGHAVWGSLTITFVILPAIFWAAISWTWWFYDKPGEDKQHRRDGLPLNEEEDDDDDKDADRNARYRAWRLRLSVLLLDPLVRQLRILWFTCRREHCKCKAGCTSSDGISRDERTRRERDTTCHEYWDKKVDKEERVGTFLSAISTLIEDAPEIILLVYIMGCGVQQEIIDYIQLFTSLLSIFYTTATLPHQVRLQKPEDARIKFISFATVALLIWRTLIVGSRILTFILFALLFRYWMFVVIGIHYFLMFALVFYQMRIIENPLEPIEKIVYNVVTPFIYIFDYCVNWLDGRSRYWYLMCYIPIYCENIIMSSFGLWYASTMPNPEWYIVPGCVCALVMFPVGILAQFAYYRYWHPHSPIPLVTPEDSGSTRQTETECLQLMTWSEFRTEVNDVNKKKEST